MKNPVLQYISIAFGITWLIGFGIAVAWHNGALSRESVSFYHSFAALGPAVAAVLTIRRHYGRDGLQRLWSRLTAVITRRSVWILALSPLLFFVAGLLLYPLMQGQWFDFGRFYSTTLYNGWAQLIWALPLFSYGILEEIGWRGFLLPHLQERYTAWKSTLLLTPVWAFWHLPFFFYRFEFSPFISVGFFFGLFVGALILTSIYNTGKGGLLPVILFHFTNNLGSAFDKDILVAVLSTCFVFLAVTLYKRYGRANLAPESRTGNYFRQADSGQK
ncbi:MAG: CPBP family intramembrane metalloprotease [Bacteroidetes bacterium]|nr:MAG: CPBP family intramembrane metalloprotease [Bacteroidota bacterium]